MCPASATTNELPLMGQEAKGHLGTSIAFLEMRFLRIIERGRKVAIDTVTSETECSVTLYWGPRYKLGELHGSFNVSLDSF